MGAYANACLARILLARELRRREVCEIIAVHPGVVGSQFMKESTCCDARARGVS